LIDQHAAHERVAFERLMAAWRGGRIEVQNFLFPLSVTLNEEKMEALRGRAEEFAKLGIELEELGPTTLGIKSAPALLKNKVLIEEFERIATDILEWGDSDGLEKAIGEICARMACHSVLRAGQSLSVPEMQRLLEEMDEHPLSSFCPHGRPVSVTYAWPELEKDFGRRV
jgi:DNA mismatch repair protein MutL